jgi:hypothetical protein
MRRFTWTVSTKGLERSQKDELSRRRDWFDWHGWLDYWLEYLLALAISLARASVVTRNTIDAEGKKMNSSREGINHAQTATLRYARVYWPGRMDFNCLRILPCSTACATRTNALPMFHGIVGLRNPSYPHADCGLPLCRLRLTVRRSRQAIRAHLAPLPLIRCSSFPQGW